MEEWRLQLGAALLAVALAALEAVRRRLKKGKRILPRVRMRTYFSIRTPTDHPSAPDETDVDLSDLDDRDTNPPKKGPRHGRP